MTIEFFISILSVSPGMTEKRLFGHPLGSKINPSIPFAAILAAKNLA